MKGRRPKTDTLASLEGGYRHGDFEQVKGSIPEAPSWISDSAQAEWRRVAPFLHQAGLLTTVDQAVLAAYCQCYAFLVEDFKTLQREGRIQEGKRHPLVNVVDAGLKQLKTYAVELGFTPSSRGRIVLPPKKTAEGDELDQFLQKQRGRAGGKERLHV